MRTFSELLDEDLRSRGLTQDQILNVLVAEDEPVVTSSAISMWRRRNRIPPVRLKRLIDFLGPDSALAKAQASGELVMAKSPLEAKAEQRAQVMGEAIEKSLNKAALRPFRNISHPPTVASRNGYGAAIEEATNAGAGPRSLGEREDYLVQRSADVLLWLQDMISPLKLTVTANIHDRWSQPMDGELFTLKGERVAVFEVKDVSNVYAGLATWAHQLIGAAWCHRHVHHGDAPVIPIIITLDSGMAEIRPAWRARPANLTGVKHLLNQAVEGGLLLPYVSIRYDPEKGPALEEPERLEELLHCLAKRTQPK